MSGWIGSLGAERRAAAPLALWTATVLSLIVLAALTARDLLLDAFWLDLASWWPLWAATAGWWWTGRRRAAAGWRSRAAPGAPLLILAGLGLALTLHLAGWSALPSSAADLSGPPPGEGPAVISVAIGGELRLGEEADGFYGVRLLRRGGPVGPPQTAAAERDGVIRLEAGEREDAGWFRSSGWEVTVSPEAPWGVEAAAIALRGDLSGVRLTALSLVGDGMLRVGEPFGRVPVRVEGEMLLEVPSRASVEVIGRAEVGPGWDFTADGRRFVGDGPGSYVVVTGDEARLRVRQWEPEPAPDTR